MPTTPIALPKPYAEMTRQERRDWYASVIESGRAPELATHLGDIVELLGVTFQEAEAIRAEVGARYDRARQEF